MILYGLVITTVMSSGIVNDNIAGGFNSLQECVYAQKVSQERAFKEMTNKDWKNTEYISLACVPYESKEKIKIENVKLSY